MTSLVIDRRNHIGGNCYDFVTPQGIRTSKYGAHLFHTNFERVWEYVQMFSEWMPYDHRVRGRVPDKDGAEQLVPIPPVRATVNALFGERISSEEEMQAWYDRQRVPPPDGVVPGRPVALRTNIQALYEEAVGQVPGRARRLRPHELALQN